MKKTFLCALLIITSFCLFSSDFGTEDGDHDVMSYQTLTILFNAVMDQKTQEACSEVLETDFNVDSIEPSLCFVDSLSDQSIATDSISTDDVLRFFAQYGLQSFLYNAENCAYIGERKVFICGDVQRGDSIQKEQLVQLTVGGPMLALIKEVVAIDNEAE